MRSFLLASLGAAAALAARSATAQPAAPAPTAPAGPAAQPAPPARGETAGGYVGYFDRKLEELLSLPLWGNTTQLPAGVLKLRLEANPARADTFYDADGKEIPLLPRIEVDDLPEPGNVLTIKPDVEGRGTGYTIQVAYGISDPVDVFVELPFQQIDSDLELNGDVDGKPLSDFTRAGVIAAIENNGRPAPNERYRGKLDLGDMMLGGAWNYHRAEHFSAATVGRVFLPTGHRADPNNDFTFLLGPELDRGVGAWALNTTQVFDVRPGGESFPYVLFDFEITGGYTFGYERKAPKWLPMMNCARIPPGSPARAERCGFPTAPAYDPGVSADLDSILPDLETMSDTYEVEPAANLDVLAAVTVEPGIPVPIQIGYEFQRQEAVTVRPADPSNEADFRFAALTRELELFAASEVHTLGIGTQVPLFPLYVPAIVSFVWRQPLAGKNSIVLKQNFSVALELFLPVGDLWMEPRELEPADH